MDYEHLQILFERMQRVQHTLGGVLLSMGLAVEVFETLPPEERMQYEEYWREMYLKTIQDLNQSLDFFTRTPAAHTDQAQLQLRQAVSTAFSPEEIVHTLRTAWQLACEQGSARDMLAAILPTLEYIMGPSITPPTSGEVPLAPTLHQPTPDQQAIAH